MNTRAYTSNVFTSVQVRYAVRYEYACHAKDFIARRTRLAFLNVQAARECLPRVRLFVPRIGQFRDVTSGDDFSSVSVYRVLTSHNTHMNRLWYYTNFQSAGGGDYG